MFLISFFEFEIGSLTVNILFAIAGVSFLALYLLTSIKKIRKKFPGRMHRSFSYTAFFFIFIHMLYNILARI
ncbi:MAG: hypothetical protein KAS39_01030 [Actinomycetia bacterium]|nr:hypothetical protein [Actinomycetes bacterium]